MHRSTPVLFLLLLAPVASAVDVPYPASSLGPVDVDLVADGGDDVAWFFAVPDLLADGECLAGSGLAQTDVSTATVTLAAGDDVVTVALQRNVDAGENAGSSSDDVVRFAGSLAVDSKVLHEASWAMDLVVRDRFGVEHDCSDVRELAVAADDDASPVVTFPSADADGVVRLAAGRSLQPSISDDLLGEVTYRIDREVDGEPAGMPEGRFYTIASPYIFGAQTFYPGEQVLTVKATDRAGNPATTATVTVFKDDVAPTLELNVTTSPFFAGVNNTVNVTVSDDTDYVGVVRFQGAVVPFEGVGGEEKSFLLAVPAASVGTATLRVRVEDAFGNVESTSETVSVEQFTTDAVIDEVEAGKGPYLLGDDVDITVVMKQDGAATAVNFTLHVDGEPLGNLTVPGDDLAETVLHVSVPPGRHNLTFRADAPEGVLVKNTTNLTTTFRVEVFLAKVTVDGDDYFVRVGDNGLPTAVVDEDGDAIDVELVELGKRSVYAFEVDDVDAYWDPAGPTEQEFSEAEAPPEDEESPGPGAVLLLLVLGALAVAVRRRS